MPDAQPHQASPRAQPNDRLQAGQALPLGILSFCLEYAHNGQQAGGIFADVRKHFGKYGVTRSQERVNQIRTTRNNYVAHQEKELTDPALARTELKNWISGLAAINKAHRG